MWPVPVTRLLWLGKSFKGPIRWQAQALSPAHPFFTTMPYSLQNEFPKRVSIWGLSPPGLVALARPTFHAALSHAWQVAVQESLIHGVCHRWFCHRVGQDSLPTLAACAILGDRDRYQVHCEANQVRSQGVGGGGGKKVRSLSHPELTALLLSKAAHWAIPVKSAT